MPKAKTPKATPKRTPKTPTPTPTSTPRPRRATAPRPKGEGLAPAARKALAGKVSKLVRSIEGLQAGLRKRGLQLADLDRAHDALDQLTRDLSIVVAKP